MALYNLVVFTNPVEGRDDEYNEWYTDVHLRDVLGIPGVVGAQRFRRSGIQRDDGPFPWGYLAIYQCDTDDVRSVIRELKTRGGTELMRMTDSLAKERFVCFFEPITELRRAPAQGAPA
jgi:hypothetical protein